MRRADRMPRPRRCAASWRSALPVVVDAGALDLAPNATAPRDRHAARAGARAPASATRPGRGLADDGCRAGGIRGRDRGGARRDGRAEGRRHGRRVAERLGDHGVGRDALAGDGRNGGRAGRRDRRGRRRRGGSGADLGPPRGDRRVAARPRGEPGRGRPRCRGRSDHRAGCGRGAPARGRRGARAR